MTTIINGINNEQVGRIIQFALDNPRKINFLSFQPVSFTGRDEEVTPERRAALEALPEDQLWATTGNIPNSIGVLAMFAKHPLLEEDDAFLSNLAEITSRIILEYRTAETIAHENAKLTAMISGMALMFAPMQVSPWDMASRKTKPKESQRDGSRNRSAKKITLHHVTTEFVQGFHLVICFDTFRHEI